MAYQHIQLRRDTAANWVASNPVLYLGETGWETDTLKAKLGDGVTTWNSLAYITGLALPANLASTASGQGDALVAVLQPFTGAVAGNQGQFNANWMTVADAGAVGDGVTDDSAALTAAFAAGVGKLIDGKTYLCANVTIPAGLTVWGNATLKLKQLGSLVFYPIFNVTGPNVKLIGLKFNGQRASQYSDPFADTFNTGPNGEGKANRSAIMGDNNGGSTVYNVYVEGCEFTAMWGGCIELRDISTVRVHNCYFHDTNFEGVGIWKSGSVPVNMTNLDIQVTDCVFNNIASSDASVNADCCLFQGITSGTFANNKATTFERDMLKCDTVTNINVTGNKADTNNYTKNFFAFQIQHYGQNVVYTGNTVINTTGFLHMDSGNTGFYNIEISGNVFLATTNFSGSSTPDGIGYDGSGTLNGLVVSGNQFKNLNRHGVQLAGGANVHIIGNFLDGNPLSTFSSFMCGVTYTAAANTNTIVISDNTIQGFQSNGCISITGGTYIVDRLKVSDNQIYNVPNFASFEVFSGTFTNCSITGNMFTGTMYWVSGVPPTATIYGNRIKLTNAQTGLFANIQGTAAAQPTVGTYSAQAVVMSSNITSSTPIGWVCTIAGTMGTYSEGRTATANGTPSVTLSSASSVINVGDWLTINSVSAMVIAINGAILTMSSNITTGSSLPITYDAASWKALPNIT